MCHTLYKNTLLIRPLKVGKSYPPSLSCPHTHTHCHFLSYIPTNYFFSLETSAAFSCLKLWMLERRNSRWINLCPSMIYTDFALSSCEIEQKQVFYYISKNVYIRSNGTICLTFESNFFFSFQFKVPSATSAIITNGEF